MDNGRDDEQLDICEHWAERIRRQHYGFLDTGITRGHKCGRCDMCCEEGDQIDHTRRDGE